MNLKMNRTNSKSWLALSPPLLEASGSSSQGTADGMSSLPSVEMAGRSLGSLEAAIEALGSVEALQVAIGSAEAAQVALGSMEAAQVVLGSAMAVQVAIGSAEAAQVPTSGNGDDCAFRADAGIIHFMPLA